MILVYVEPPNCDSLTNNAFHVLRISDAFQSSDQC